MLAPFFGRLAQHSHVSSANIAKLSALPWDKLTVEPHATIVREGEIPQFCYVLLQGWTVRQKITGEGARQILALQHAGDALDLQHLMLNRADHNVQTLSNSAVVARVSRVALWKLLLGSPELAFALWRDSLIDASIAREWVVNVGRRRGRTRVAHLLCEIAVRQQGAERGAPSRIHMPLTQEQLGDAAGLTPVHTNRVLRVLDQSGAVSRNRDQVQIEDWDQMVTIADFDPTYLHMECAPAPS
jgi:CRP-like cAMP-binding protein